MMTVAIAVGSAVVIDAAHMEERTHDEEDAPSSPMLLFLALPIVWVVVVVLLMIGAV